MATEPPAEAKPKSYATNEEMIAIAGVTRDTLYKWVRDKMLPRPKITSTGRGTRSLWPLEAVERARFIVERRGEFHTMEEIREMVLERWPPPPKAQSTGKGR
jgi:predicted DNA-binding transcriptional regulator AlpA